MPINSHTFYMGVLQTLKIYSSGSKYTLLKARFTVLNLFILKLHVESLQPIFSIIPKAKLVTNLLFKFYSLFFDYTDK